MEILNRNIFIYLKNTKHKQNEPEENESSWLFETTEIRAWAFKSFWRVNNQELIFFFFSYSLIQQ